MYNRILLPVDVSASADRALDEAINLAREHAGELRIVYVDGVEEISRQIIEAAVARGRSAGLRPECGLLVKLTTEEVANVILQEAKNWAADLIVMGTRTSRFGPHVSGQRRRGGDRRFACSGLGCPHLLKQPDWDLNRMGQKLVLPP